MKYGKNTRMKGGQKAESVLRKGPIFVFHVLQKLFVKKKIFSLHLLKQIANIGSLLCWQSEYFRSDSNKNGKEVLGMAKCAVCGKGAHFGIKVSHSHRRSNRMWKSNIKSVKAIVNGTPKRINVCTSCLRSGKVERA